MPARSGQLIQIGGAAEVLRRQFLQQLLGVR